MGHSRMRIKEKRSPPLLITTYGKEMALNASSREGRISANLRIHPSIPTYLSI